MNTYTKICPKCNEPFTVRVKTGIGRMYCTRACANARSHSNTTKKKIGKTVRNTWDAKTPEGRKKSLEAIQRGQQTRKANRLKFLTTTATEDLPYESIRQKLLLEQDNCCLKCNTKEWQGQPLVLELDHIDGDRANNKQGNLRMLCPNCHSQTVTWRGRKKLTSPNGAGLA